MSAAGPGVDCDLGVADVPEHQAKASGQFRMQFFISQDESRLVDRLVAHLDHRIVRELNAHRFGVLIGVPPGAPSHVLT